MCPNSNLHFRMIVFFPQHLSLSPLDRNNCDLDLLKRKVFQQTFQLSQQRVSTPSIFFFSLSLLFFEFEERQGPCSMEEGEGKVTTIWGLPGELFAYKIFRYLEPKEILLSVATVCKKWNSYCRDPLLWHYHCVLLHQQTLSTAASVKGEYLSDNSPVTLDEETEKVLML